MTPFQNLKKNLKSDIDCLSIKGDFLIVKLFFHPSFLVSFFYRLSYYFYQKRCLNIARFFCFVSRIVTGCDLHYNAKIAGGVLFPHGKGVVIGEGVVIGSKCSIFHQTTIGGTEKESSFPIIEEGVNVYPGSVIAGGMTVGAWSRVGPNVYLTESVASHTRISPLGYQEKRNI